MKTKRCQENPIAEGTFRLNVTEEGGALVITTPANPEDESIELCKWQLFLCQDDMGFIENNLRIFNSDDDEISNTEVSPPVKAARAIEVGATTYAYKLGQLIYLTPARAKEITKLLTDAKAAANKKLGRIAAAKEAIKNMDSLKTSSLKFSQENVRITRLLVKAYTSNENPDKLIAERDANLAALKVVLAEIHKVKSIEFEQEALSS